MDNEKPVKFVPLLERNKLFTPYHTDKESAFYFESDVLECLKEFDNILKVESLKAEEREQPNESIAYSNARMYLKRFFGDKR